jgi:carbonic anhydrase
MLFPGALILLQATGAAAAGSWVYAKSGYTYANAAHQTATWGGLCVTGNEQSPINVVTTATSVAALTIIETNYSTTASYVKHTGYGWQVFETSPNSHVWNSATSMGSVDQLGNSAKGYAMIGGAKYDFYQVHWHTPSENSIDGKLFALEAHFVHQLADDALHGTYHRLAVIGLLYELDATCNTFLDKFWGSFPNTTGSAQYTGTNFDLNQKLTDELAKGYYHWYGSLTTPPCTEGVSWNLLKTRESVPEAGRCLENCPWQHSERYQLQQPCHTAAEPPSRSGDEAWSQPSNCFKYNASDYKREVGVRQQR